MLDAFGHTATGRIKFRRVVNAQVKVSKTTSGPVGWRPISWGLISADTRPGREVTRQIVPSTDGKVRLVEAEWRTGSSLRVRVIRVVGRGYPSRLVTFNDRFLYWVAADRSLHRATWTGTRFIRPTTLPVSISGATAMTAHSTDRGSRIYYTDRAGALHVVADEGARSTDTVIRSSGYRTVTGLRSGSCMVPDYSWISSDVGLLSVDRATGVGRFQRVLRPSSTTGGSVTRAVRVPPSDWTWRRLG